MGSMFVPVYACVTPPHLMGLCRKCPQRGLLQICDLHHISTPWHTVAHCLLVHIETGNCHLIRVAVQGRCAILKGPDIISPGYKHLSEAQYADFAEQLCNAKLTTENRAENVALVQESLEVNLELIGLTGVEDRLQPDVQR